MMASESHFTTRQVPFLCWPFRTASWDRGASLESKLPVERQRRNLFSVRFEKNARPPLITSEIDAGLHQFVADPATLKGRIDRHLCQLECRVRERYHCHCPGNEVTD